MSLAKKIIKAHLVEGRMNPGEEIGIKIDQTLTQDATGTLVMLELEALGIDRVKTEISAQYVDHNLLQEDAKNPDDHLFLRQACQRFGLYYSRAGNGISHVVHQESFGLPGKTLLGSDSHTPAAGALGMLAIAAGGLEVAMAMASEPFYFQMPEVWGVELTGQLSDWVSAKDIILEMLRRHGVRGGCNTILEYFGPGLTGLSIMDRHVIANMGTELGATTSIFPSDKKVAAYLQSQGRSGYTPMDAGTTPAFDRTETINLYEIEPLIAMPSSPGHVRKVAEVAGEDIYQVYIGSSANPGYRDFAIASEIVRGKKVPAQVSFDINPSSRQVLSTLDRDGFLLPLINAGARMHQTGCNGCIGMGQAPATGTISLRTVPRNFPGRSGTPDDRVCLVSPETAAASALMGKITDPRTLKQSYLRISEPDDPIRQTDLIEPPLPLVNACRVNLKRGPNISKLPVFNPLAQNYELPVLLQIGDDISTDEILPAGAKALPYRSNIPKISEFAFAYTDPDYINRTKTSKGFRNHVIVAGENYGQGSSREHAALCLHYRGLIFVIAKSFARIHWQNLISFGVLPFTFRNPDDFASIAEGDTLRIDQLNEESLRRNKLKFHNQRTCQDVPVTHRLSARQIEIIIAGGLINWTQIHRLQGKRNPA